jgi:hypothetical protein
MQALRDSAGPAQKSRSRSNASKPAGADRRTPATARAGRRKAS